mmetsp:Transcript_29177/g.78301  ORF Transcript_29177/g.78301 Transcript_29177/m.78301 type:complete len:160 (-) Transcript_29177:81-560(-)
MELGAPVECRVSFKRATSIRVVARIPALTAVPGCSLRVARVTASLSSMAAPGGTNAADVEEGASLTTALGFVDAADARFPTMPVAVKRAAGPTWRETETLRVVYAETGDMTTLVAPDAGSVSVDASLPHGSSPSIDRPGAQAAACEKAKGEWGGCHNQI